MVSISLKVAVTQMVNIKKTVFFNSFGSLKKKIHYCTILSTSFGRFF